MADLDLKNDHSEGDVFYAGTTADVNKLNGITTAIDNNTRRADYHGVLFHNQAEELFDGTLDGSDFINYKFDLFANTTYLDATITEANDAWDDYAVASNYLLSYNAMSKGGSSESDWWTESTNITGSGAITTSVGTRTGSDTHVTVTAPDGVATAELIADGTYARNFKITDKDVRIHFHLVQAFVDNTTNNTQYCRFGLTDGTNYVWLKSWTTSEASDTSDWGIVIDYSGATCDVFDDEVLDSDDVDLSSITGDYHLVFESSVTIISGAGGDASADMVATDIRWIEQDRATEVVSTVSTASSSVLGAIFAIDTEDLNGEAAPTYNISGDGATDFTAILKDTDTSLSAASQGTSVHFKISFPHTSGGDWLDGTNAFNSDGIPRLKSYAIMWRDNI